MPCACPACCAQAGSPAASPGAQQAQQAQRGSSGVPGRGQPGWVAAWLCHLHPSSTCPCPHRNSLRPCNHARSSFHMHMYVFILSAHHPNYGFTTSHARALAMQAGAEGSAGFLTTGPEQATAYKCLAVFSGLLSAAALLYPGAFGVVGVSQDAANVLLRGLHCDAPMCPFYSAC